MLDICRTCLRQIANTDYINLEDSNSLQDKLLLCIPEMAWDLVKNPGICTACANALHSAYNFKNQCLQTDQYIRNFVQIMPQDTGSVCLMDVYNSLNDSHSQLESLDVKGAFTSISNSTLCVAEKVNISDGPSYSTQQIEPIFDSQNNELVVKEEFDVIIPDVKVKEEPSVLACEDFESICPQNKITEKATDENIPVDKPFSCDMCNFKYAQEDYLIDHMKFNHGGNKTFSCSRCDFTTTHKMHLFLHQRTHEGEKLFTCDTCSYSSPLKQSVLHHVMQVHNREKPFACSRCDFSTTHLPSLSDHMKVHAKVRQCDKCTYSSRYLASLLVHKLIHN